MDWLSSVKRLVAEVSRSDVTELELTRGSFHVRIRRAQREYGEQDSLVPEAEAVAETHQVVAPLTGIFYRAPSPSSPPFVEQGDWVEADTVIGLIESMKVFNQVTAGRPGRVAGFVAQSGQLVHAGEPLLVLDTAEPASALPEVGR